MNDHNQQHAQDTELTRRLNALNDHLDAMFAADLDDPQRTEAFLTELARRTANTPDSSAIDSPVPQPTRWAASRNTSPIGARVDTTSRRESPRFLLTTLAVGVAGVSLVGIVVVLMLLGGSPALILPIVTIASIVVAALYGARSARRRRQVASTRQPQYMIMNVGCNAIGANSQIVDRDRGTIHVERPAAALNEPTSTTAEPTGKDGPESRQSTDEGT